MLDADIVKDYLLRDAIEQGIYIDLLSIDLADGHRLMPRELATLVHTESTKLLDIITEICLSRGENLVLEGTFSWPGLGPRLLRDLAYADYEKFTILDVEAPQNITRARALTGGGGAGRTRCVAVTVLVAGSPRGSSSTPSTPAAPWRRCVPATPGPRSITHCPRRSRRSSCSSSMPTVEMKRG
ncbi:hypothetical protein ACFWAY_51980 [Rhodococcus sp. NPDC059968]|uniref:hypothetical protein n=1 Tax=Rhodococcus sp. NPDC059968 TaxID=3347017 RepID=UPI00366FA0F9